MRRTFVILTWCVRSHAWPCIFEFRMNDKIFETWFDENATWSELNRTAGDILDGMHAYLLEQKDDTHFYGYGCDSSACTIVRLPPFEERPSSRPRRNSRRITQF